ncbi:hypothetical protein [Amycolatopsis sulphurea]|uniref:hypothetical protein n=1 Tax=Amycolatopsis sulphurea TaxID=76022 RepID=UPI001145E2E5|nr:hypothetical protein [Amycolatopsis sulphurea]
MSELGQTDVVLDGWGSVDLRNGAHVDRLGLVVGSRSIDLEVEFGLENGSGEARLTLLFSDVSVFSLEPELPLEVDPAYGHALLTELRAWRDTRPGFERRAGFSLGTTLMSLDFYATGLSATVRPLDGERGIETGG